MNEGRFRRRCSVGVWPCRSTFALNNATLPFISLLADKDVKVTLEEDADLLTDLYITQGANHVGAIAHDISED